MSVPTADMSVTKTGGIFPTRKKKMDLSDSFDSDFLSDCTIWCGDRVWKLHKIILCPRSEFFRAAFTGKFKEAETGELVLEEQDPEYVGHALRFIYSENLDHIAHVFDPLALDSTLLAFTMSVKLFNIASFLQLPTLCQEVVDRLTLFDRKQARVKQKAWLANTQQVHMFTQNSEFKAAFAEIAKEAFDIPEIGPASIRRPFINHFRFTRFAVAEDKEFLTKLEQAPALLTAIIAALGSSVRPQLRFTRRTCRMCSRNPWYGGEKSEQIVNLWYDGDYCHKCSSKKYPNEV